MKFLLVLSTAVTVTFFLQHCSPKTSEKRDTTGKREITTIIYSYDKFNNDFRIGAAIRFVHDTFIETRDSSSGKIVLEKKWTPDTVYYIAFKDTSRGKDNKPIFDTLKNPVMQWFWPVIPRNLVIKDLNYDWQK